MLKTLLLLVTSYFFVSPGIAQVFPEPVSPYIKTGAYSSSPTLFSSIGNVAAFAKDSNFTMGVFAENKFLMKDLNSFAGIVSMPAGRGCFRVSLQQAGAIGFHPLQAGLAYSRSLGDKIDIGLRFQYHNLSVKGYGRSGAASFDAGFIFHFNEALHGGISVSNPTSSTIGKFEQERLPSLYSFGLGYNVSDKLFVSTEIEKYPTWPPGVLACVQYQFMERLRVKGGIATATSIMFFGVGIVFNNLSIDVTSSVHPQLGLTPGLMLVYKNKRT